MSLLLITVKGLEKQKPMLPCFIAEKDLADLPFNGPHYQFK